MSDNVLSHNEMCRREGASLQRGMNFGLGGNHSVILMSVRPNAPYRDRLEDGGTTLIYEGHDQPKTVLCPNPKLVDQPGALPSGTLTQNVSSIKPLKSSRRASARPNEFASMKRFGLAYGHPTASFISSMHGQNVTNTGLYTSSSSSPWKGMKILHSRFTSMQNGGASFRQP